MRDNATDKKSDGKQSDEGKEPIAKAEGKRRADEPSRAHRSGNPIGRVYNGRGLILDSRK
jgi:hypothetical protein